MFGDFFLHSRTLNECKMLKSYNQNNIKDIHKEEQKATVNF